MRAGNILIGVGAVAIVIGLAARAGWLSWFGHLPGDIRTESGNGRFYLPITSSLVVSVVITIALNLVARFLRDR